jgi:RNA polymerase sigma-32 factor
VRDADRQRPLSLYLRELGQHAPIGRDEEHTLAVEYQRTGRAELARRLVLGHLRLVIKIAREYYWARHDLADLIAEGNVGLLIALTKYDPKRGVRLSSYAVWWIRAMIQRFIIENRRLVRIGTTAEQRKVMAHLGAEKAKLQQQGILPTTERLAQILGVRSEGLAALEQHIGSAEVSLDAPTGDDEGTSRLALLPAPSEMRPDELVERSEHDARLRGAVDEFLGTLGKRDRQLFRARWTEDDQPTLQEMGDRFGVSRERARQLEKRLLQRFRVFAAHRLKDVAEVSRVAA